MSVIELPKHKLDAPKRSTLRSAWVKSTLCDFCGKYTVPRYGIVKDGQSGHREILSCTNCGRNPYHKRDRPYQYKLECKKPICVVNRVSCQGCLHSEWIEEE